MTACRDWNERLLDYALGGLGASAVSQVDEHLKGCPACAAALHHWRARRGQLDAALCQLVRGAEPSPSFRARVLAGVEARSALGAAGPAWAGVLAGVAVMVLVAAWLPSLGERGAGLTSPELISSAATISAWRSPTQSLLRSPADELLRSTPRLGEFYFPLQPVPAGMGQENGGNDES